MLDRSAGYRAVTTTLAAAMRAVTRDVTQGLVLTMIVQFGSGIVSFVMFYLAARVLSSVEFGHLALWLSVCQMASVVAILGQEMFILRSLNEYSVSARLDLAKGSLLFSMGLVPLVPVLFGFGMGAIGIGVFGQSVAVMMATGLFLISSSVLALSSHIARSTVGILLAEGMREMFWRSITVAALLGLVAAGEIIRLDEFFFLASVAILISISVQAFAIWRALPTGIFEANAAWRLREWSRVSVGFWVSTILETTNQYFDVVIVYWFLDPASAGAYFIASRLANMFATLLTSVHSFATRRIPALYFGGKTDELNSTLRRMAEVVLLCVVIGILVIAFGAESILGLFGPGYVAQKWTLIILTAGTALYAAGGPAPALLMIAGHEARYPWIVAANISLRFIGFALLIPKFGLLGAAIAAAISLCIVTVVLNVLCRRWVGVDPSVLGLLAKSGDGILIADKKPS